MLLKCTLDLLTVGENKGESEKLSHPHLTLFVALPLAQR